MKYYGFPYIPVLVFCLCATSCSKRLTKSNVVETTAETPENKEKKTIDPYELQADGENDRQKKSWDEIAAQAENSDSFKRLKNQFDNEPAIDPGHFSSLETEHVKISNYDPFGKKEYLSYDLTSMQEKFHYPCDGKLISDYGMRSRRMHTGVDIKASYGADIYAAFDGVVRMSKYYSGYGNVVVIRHNNGLETVYGHNSRNKVKVNQAVKAGDVIALAGRTGRASTEHCHFEVRVQGQYFNPNLLIDVQNNKLQQKQLYVYKRGASILASNREPSSSGGNSRTLAEKTPETTTADNSASGAAPTAAVSKQEPVKSSIAPKEGSTQGSGDAVYHKIVSGDTLYAIALRNKTTVAAICKLNGISPNKVLSIGQRLRIK